jgi:hypothetical protein
MIAVEIQLQPDAAKLRETINHLRVSTFYEGADLKLRARQMTKPMERLSKLLATLQRRGSRAVMGRLISRAVKFIRDDVGADAKFEDVMESLAMVLEALPKVETAVHCPEVRREALLDRRACLHPARTQTARCIAVTSSTRLRPA